MVDYELSETERQQVLDQTYPDYPERFVRRPPRVLPRLPAEVWINNPADPDHNTP